MNAHPCLVDIGTLHNEFPDARQLSDLDRTRLLAFWAEVATAPDRHGYGDRLDLATALNHMTAFVVAGDQSLKKTLRRKRARETVQQLRGAMNLVLRYGLFVNPETRGSA